MCAVATDTGIAMVCSGASDAVGGCAECRVKMLITRNSGEGAVEMGSSLVVVRECASMRARDHAVLVCEVGVRVVRRMSMSVV